MSNYEPTAERFAADVKDHQMTVIRADGVHRHLQFRKPGTRCYGFDLITWPGVLCIHGDCGTYVFERLEDMFQFFRNPAGAINPGYWAEKCTSASLDAIKRFEWDAFERNVRAHMDEWCSGAQDPAAADEVRSEVLDELSGIEQDEFGAVAFIRDFHHAQFQFVDWEADSREYEFHFIWCLRAIVWGIQQWDAAQAKEQAA